MEILNTEKDSKSQIQNRIDISQWAGNWIWRAAQCLIESPDFNPSPKWAAARLNVSVEKIVEAFDGLERLGIIQRKDNTFKVNSEWFQVTTDQASSDNLLAAHTKLAPQILSKLTSDDKFTVQFFRGDRALLARYAPKFIQLYKEMNDEARAKGLTDIIASEISFAILTSEKNGGTQ